jgi:hypothetical protein
MMYACCTHTALPYCTHTVCIPLYPILCTPYSVPHTVLIRYAFSPHLTLYSHDCDHTLYSHGCNHTRLAGPGNTFQTSALFGAAGEDDEAEPNDRLIPLDSYDTYKPTATGPAAAMSYGFGAADTG